MNYDADGDEDFEQQLEQILESAMPLRQQA